MWSDLHEILVHLHKDWKRMNSNIFWCDNLKILWHNIDVINADDVWNYVIIWRDIFLGIEILHNIQLIVCVTLSFIWKFMMMMGPLEYGGRREKIIDKQGHKAPRGLHEWSHTYSVASLSPKIVLLVLVYYKMKEEERRWCKRVVKKND